MVLQTWEIYPPFNLEQTAFSIGVNFLVADVLETVTVNVSKTSYCLNLTVFIKYLYLLIRIAKLRIHPLSSLTLNVECLCSMIKPDQNHYGLKYFHESSTCMQ